jgi:hypothetical protein
MRDPEWRATQPLPLCGVYFGVSVRLTENADEVDCAHCLRQIHKKPAPQTNSGKARWRAMKALAAAHPEEYARLLAEAEEEVVAE